LAALPEAATSQASAQSSCHRSLALVPLAHLPACGETLEQTATPTLLPALGEPSLPKATPTLAHTAHIGVLSPVA